MSSQEAKQTNYAHKLSKRFSTSNNRYEAVAYLQGKRSAYTKGVTSFDMIGHEDYSKIRLLDRAVYALLMHY